ncbi:hypothetical protein HMN09_00479500 [Mycena chlorophos]|uniref:Uncharacterized protein n=1 Tax=Mycena chlorophos TaxID=658473 RepID=A0A8H6TF16_MYCCL|nr:hypothetical protein HMN09_00479500 [Mycena chlorophos]
MAPSALEIGGYIRVAALAVGAFDYFQVLPFTVRLSREPWTTGRISSTFVLFFLLQVTSITVLTVSDAGFFSNSFSYAACQRFFLLPGICKLLQAGVVQVILGLRAWNLARKSRAVALFIIAAYIVCGTLACITTVYKRTIAWKPTIRNCSSVGPSGVLGGWVYYGVAFAYDFIVTCISGWYLLRMALPPRTAVTGMSRLSRMILIDGLWYFVVLSAANLASVAFYRITDIKFSTKDPAVKGDLQTAAATMGYAVRWIMAQKMIINLHQAAIARREDSIADALSTAGHVTTRMETNTPGGGRRRTRRTKTRTKTGRFSFTVPDFEESFDSRMEARTPTSALGLLRLEGVKEEGEVEGDGGVDEEEEEEEDGHEHGDPLGVSEDKDVVSVHLERSFQLSSAGRRKAAEALSMGRSRSGSGVRYSSDVASGSRESGDVGPGRRDWDRR